METPAEMDAKPEVSKTLPVNTVLDAKIKLKRFCYIGTFISVYVYKRVINVSICLQQIFEISHCLSSREFVEILKDVLSRKSLVRRDEAIFAFAAYLASDVETEPKIYVRIRAPELLETDEDLFIFCTYSKAIQTELKRKCFSRTTQKAVQDWYKNRSVEALQAMWYKNRRGEHGYTHTKLIRIFGITDEMLGDDKIATPFFQKCWQILSSGEIMQSENHRGPKLYSDALVAMSKLRSINLNPLEAAELVKEYNFKLDEVPRLYYKVPAVMRLLIPQMSYKQLLKYFNQVWRQYQFEDPKGIKLFNDILENKQLLAESDIHPLNYFIELNRIGFRWIRSDKEKGSSSTNSKKYVVSRHSYFLSLYKISFGTNQATGLRMSITINLQDNYKTKKLKNFKKVNYLDAAVALAFGYFKVEKCCKVFSFSEKTFEVKSIDWQKTMNIEGAMNYCEDYKSEKSVCRLIEPIFAGLKQKDTYDLFLVIVPTAGRHNPGKSSDFLSKFLDKYRQERNPRAKFVIVSMRKFKQSMTYSQTRNDNILEICGVDTNTVNLINDFALNRFS